MSRLTRSRRIQSFPTEWAKFRHKPADYMYAGFFEDVPPPIVTRLDRSGGYATNGEHPEGLSPADLEDFDAVAPTLTAPRRFYDLYRLMSTLTGLLVITSVVMFAGAAAFIYRAKLMANIAEGTGVKVSSLNTADSTLTGLANASFVAGVALGFMFIIWQFSFAHNAQVLRGRVTLDERWAVLGWAVPFILPGLQLWSAAKASDPNLPMGAPVKRGKAPVIIPIWAFSVGLGSLLYLLSTRSRPKVTDVALATPEVVAKFATADRQAFLSFVVLSVGMILTLTLLRRLSHDQSAIMVLLGETPDYTAAWTMSGNDLENKSAGSVRIRSTNVGNAPEPAGASGKAAGDKKSEPQVRLVRVNRR